MAKLQEIYLAFFGRSADPQGLGYWEKQLAKGMSMIGVAESISQTEEFQDVFSGRPQTLVIEQIFHNLFGRSIDDQDLLFYEAELASGQATAATVAIDFLSAAEGQDLSALSAKVAAAQLYTSGIDTNLEIAAYQGRDAADIAHRFLQSVSDLNLATPEAVDRAILGLLNSGGGAQSPEPNGGEINGVQYWLNAAITPHKVVDGEKLLLIGEGSAEGFSIATSNSSQLELGLGVHDAVGNPLLSRGFVEGHIAGFDNTSLASKLAISIASLGQRELEEFSFRLSVDTDPTEGLSWKHYLLEGRADQGYAWSLEQKSNANDDNGLTSLPIGEEQGSFMILDKVDMSEGEGTFDFRLDAFEGGFLVAEAAVRVTLIGAAEQFAW